MAPKFGAAEENFSTAPNFTVNAILRAITSSLKCGDHIWVGGKELTNTPGELELAN